MVHDREPVQLTYTVPSADQTYPLGDVQQALTALQQVLMYVNQGYLPGPQPAIKDET